MQARTFFGNEEGKMKRGRGSLGSPNGRIAGVSSTKTPRRPPPPPPAPPVPKKRRNVDPLSEDHAVDKKYRFNGKSDVQKGQFATGWNNTPLKRDHVATKNRARAAARARWAKWKDWKASEYLEKNWSIGSRELSFDTAKLDEYDAEHSGQISGELSLSRRHAIRYLFEWVYGTPPKDEWKGVGGVITLIRRTLCIPLGSGGLIENVLNDIVKCGEQKKEFTGKSRKKGKQAEIQDLTPQAEVVYE